MKTLSVLITILLLGCTMLFTSCTKDELSAPQLHEDVLASDRSPVEKPFKGYFLITPQLVSQEPGILTLIVEGEGTATHIGNSTFVADEVVDISNYPQLTAEAEYIMTAANGDRFWGTWNVEGYYYPDGSGVNVTGIMHVDGGDGRFEDASGELPFYGESFWVGTSYFVFHDGTLIY